MTATHTADPGTSPEHATPTRKLPKEIVAKSNSDFSKVRNIAIIVLIAVVVAVIALVAIATYIVNPIVAAQDGTPAATTTTTPAPAAAPVQQQTAAPAAAPQQQATAWPAPGTQMEPTGCYGANPRTLTAAGEVFNPYNCQLRFFVEEGCIDILDRAGEPLLVNFCTNHGTVDLSLPMYWVRATTGTARITRNWCPPNSPGNYVDTCN